MTVTCRQLRDVPTEILRAALALKPGGHERRRTPEGYWVIDRSRWREELEIYDRRLEPTFRANLHVQRRTVERELRRRDRAARKAESLLGDIRIWRLV